MHVRPRARHPPFGKRARGAIAHAIARAAALAFPIAGCSLDELDYAGKACPCPDGYRCDAATQRCARGEAVPADASTDACSPAIVPTAFRVGWTTPNTIRWQWDPAGDTASFGRYELRMGHGDPSAADPDSAEMLWTSAQNPELGKFLLPHTGGDDPTHATVADDLTPATQYWGQLVARDAAGCASTTQVVGALTADAPAVGHEVVLFHDALPGGAYLNAENTGAFVVTDDASLAYGGGACLTFDPDATVGSTLHVAGLGADMSAIGADIGKTAYLELAFALGATSYYSVPFVSFTDGPSYGFEPYTLGGADAYRVVQIPLRELTHGEQALPQSELAKLLDQVDVAGAWTLGARVRIDEIRVVW